MERMPYLTLVWVVLLAGCASAVPERIRTEPADAPGLAAVLNAPAHYIGKTMRWGGVIVALSNRAEETRIEIVAKPLASSGGVKPSDKSPGRFIARVPGFLDPAVYVPTRLITVVGSLEGSEQGRIGDYPYAFPVVKVEAHYLWPRVEPVPRGDDPFLYDPWYPYYYPYPYPYPYRRPWTDRR